jgi:CRISPR-associated protein Cas2
MHHVIAFDVVDDKRRRQVVKVLRTRAVRVQQSVFEANLDPEGVRALRRELEALLAFKEGDRIGIYPVPKDDWQRAWRVGLAPTLPGVLLVPDEES